LKRKVVYVYESDDSDDEAKADSKIDIQGKRLNTHYFMNAKSDPFQKQNTIPVKV